MDELSEAARALLETARSADDPTHAERERADTAVRTALAAHGVHLPTLAPSASPSADAALPRANPVGIGGAPAVTVGVGVLALCIGAWVAVRGYDRGTQPQPQPSPAAVAVARAPQGHEAEAPGAVLHAIDTRPVAPADATPVRRSSRPRIVPRRPAVHGPNIDAEVQLIAEADAQLRAERFDVALRTLASHARRFPDGALREERAALRVLSLCGKGPSERALRERERFLQTAPESVLAARVGAACLEPGANAP